MANYSNIISLAFFNQLRYQCINNVELLNENFTPANLFTQFFVIGGVYFLGPDIMSRNFISKDEHTAKNSARISRIVLLIFSLVITLVGMWIRFNVTPEELGESGALMYAVSLLPKALGILLLFGLLSAILSSTDTCLINASTIFVKDILKKESVSLVKITVLSIGGLSLLLAVLGRGDRLHISLCASLGFLSSEQFKRVYDAGVRSYHNNIETSRGYFPKICTTHTFDDTDTRDSA